MLPVDPPQTSSADPEASRVERRKAWKGLLRSMRAPLRISDEAIAAGVGVSKTQLRRWLDDGELDSMPLSDVEALPEQMRRELLERLAAALGLEVREPAPPTPAENTGAALARFGRLQAELHDVLTLYFGAVNKGVLVGPSASKLRREIAEARRELDSLDALAEKAERERVYGLSRRSADVCAPDDGSNGSGAAAAE